MNTRKAVWLLVMMLVALLAWGGAYPALAGLLFTPEGGPPSTDWRYSDAPNGTPAPNVLDRVALPMNSSVPNPPPLATLNIKPKLPVLTKFPILTLLAPTPTKTPKIPIFKVTLIPPVLLTAIFMPTDTPGPPPAPTNTPTPTSTKTPKPTKTPQPTWTPVTPAPCFYDAAYIADLTIPDGAKVLPGAPLQKIWRVQNIGSCPWGAGVQLVFQGGNPLGAPPVQFVPPIAPGATADLVVNMFAPVALGLTEGHWRLRDPDGDLFGPDLFIRVLVAPASAPPKVAPTLTAAPAATWTPGVIIITPGPMPTSVAPAATPDTRTFTSLRQAYDLARPKVSVWKSTATLLTATCLSLPPQPGFAPGVQFFTPWQGPALGKCGEWRLVFLDGATPQPGARAFTAVVTTGRFNDRLSKETLLTGPTGTPLGVDWLDSPAALQAFNRAGGSDFFSRYPDGRITSFQLRASQDQGVRGAWWVAATSRLDYRPGSSLKLNLDAKDGSVDATAPATAQLGKVYLSALEAFAVAQEAGAVWQADAQLVHLKAQVNPDEEGYDVAKASNWWFEFSSPSARKGYTLNVVDGVARNAAEEPAVLGDIVAGDWGDSPAALDELRDSADFAAFNALHPQPGFSLELLGDAQEGFIWIVGAYDAGGALTVNVNRLQ